MFNAVFLLVVGLVFILGGVWVRHIEARERVTMIEAQGVIVDSVKHRERDNSTGKDKDTYEPVIEFRANGAPVRLSGSRESYEQSKGNRVAVRFDPRSPATTAYVAGGFDGLVSWAVFAMGGIGLVSGVRELLRVRRASRPTA